MASPKHNLPPRRMVPKRTHVEKHLYAPHYRRRNRLKPGEIPPRYREWGVSRRNGKYIELSKRFGKKMKFLYIGVKWDKKKVDEKIKKFEINNPELVELRKPAALREEATT